MTDQEQPCRAETQSENEPFLDLQIKHLSCIHQRKETLKSQMAPLESPSLVSNDIVKINLTFGILLLSEQKSGKSPLPMRLLQRSSPQNMNTSRQVQRGPLLLLWQLWKWSELSGPEKLFHSASPIHQQKLCETGLVTSATCKAISNASPMHYAWTTLEYFSPFQIQVWPMLLVKSASCPVAICIV